MKTTLKELKTYKVLTDEEAETFKIDRVIAVSYGTYGANGLLGYFTDSRDGGHYLRAIIGRSTKLFQFLV